MSNQGRNVEMTVQEAKNIIERSWSAPGQGGRTSTEVAIALQVLYRAQKDELAEKMRQLAESNVIVRTCLDMQRDPSVTYEVALERMVIALAEQNEAALAELLAIKQRGLPPMVIVTSQEQADQIRARYDRGEPAPDSSAKKL